MVTACGTRIKVTKGPRGRLFIESVKGEEKPRQHFKDKRDEADTHVYVGEGKTLEVNEKKLQTAVEEGDEEELEKRLRMKRKIAEHTAKMKNLFREKPLQKQPSLVDLLKGKSRSEIKAILREAKKKK
jgi:hypothetical protein